MQDLDLELPDGFVARRLRPGDVQAVADLVAATELDVDGVVEIDVTDVQGDWERPSFDLASMAVGVEHEGDLVGFGEVFIGRAEVEVHPAHRGKGIGTALQSWTSARARRDGRREVTQIVSDAHATAIAVLEATRFEPTYTSWILRIRFDTDDIDEPELPEGLEIRDLRPGDDDRKLFDLIDTAFGEWDHRERQSFEDWAASVLKHEAVRPDVTPIVVDGDRLVGVAIGMDYREPLAEGWVPQLAVDRAYRGRGLGRALLVESFRRFKALGHEGAGLSTDSRTGALGLYEHVGMHVDRSYTCWAKRLDEG